MNNNLLNSANQEQYRQQSRFQSVKAFLLSVPLIVFLIVFFITPIGFMLYKSFYNPTLIEVAPNIVKTIKNWQDTKILPNETIFKVVAYEIKSMQQQRLSGKFAEEVNRRVSATGSTIKRTARKLKTIDLDAVDDYKALLISTGKRWSELKIWHGIKAASQPYSIDYYIHALDYKSLSDGSIVKQPEYLQVYIPILKRTFIIAFLVTLFTFMLGYPLAYYLSSLPSNKANLLLILVLLPFWTSLLVRTTSWIVILQNNGIVNSILQKIGFIDEPLDIIYNQFSTVIAMTHILLPFMILPLYSVMRGIDSSYVRASKSLGANPFMSFIRVYFPLSVPGLNAGALLVFILAIGYYITPALLGGSDGQLISNLIAFHMRDTNNWELAAALGSILLILILILYGIYDKLVGASNLKL